MYFRAAILDLPAHPQFSKRYVVGGDDETAVRALWTDERIAFLERQQNLCVQGCDHQLLGFCNKKRISPHDVENFIEEGFDVYAQFHSTANA
jgi:hypothetical protein